MSYTLNGTVGVGATKTPLIVTGSATIVACILAMCWSTDGVPTSDQSLTARIQRTTAAGTTTAATPNPTRGFNPAASAGGITATVEPTYTAGQLYLRGINARATVQWNAYDAESGLCSLPVAANGIGIQMVTQGGSIGNFLADITFKEG